jgi:putative ABC transport system substrate-binding protein
MRRREFIGLIGGAAATWPFTACAQQGGKPVIGYLGPTSAENDKDRIGIFLQRLDALGWFEGRNFEIKYRWAEGHPDAMEQISAEFVKLKVTVIVTYGSAAVMAAKRATSEIPIVFGPTGDPVGNGIVANLARPGGNVTGLSTLQTELAAKRFELVRQIVPNLRRIALLANADSPGAALEMRDVEATARTLGIASEPIQIRRVEELAPAFDALKGRVDLVHLCTDPLVTTNRARIADLALGAGLPTVYALREYVQVGGLLSYGPSIPAMFRPLADYVDKILHGIKPGEIPVEQPTRFELAINLRTAKALGLAVPPTLLATADEVIE